MPRSNKPSDTAATPASWLLLDHQMCFALYSASLAMTKLYKPLLQPLGLTYPQYLVMLVLWEGDGITVSQLGDRLALDSGTLTPLLKRLEALQLLQRLRDATDERRVLLQLSAAGRALKKKAAAVPPAIASASGCSLGELSSLTARLQTLRAQLTESLPAQPRPQGRSAHVTTVPSTTTKETAPWPSTKPSTPPTPPAPAAAPAPPLPTTAA